MGDDVALSPRATRVLERLRNPRVPGGCTPRAQLGMSTSACAVAMVLAELNAAGHKVVRVPKEGYRLVEVHHCGEKPALESVAVKCRSSVFGAKPDGKWPKPDDAELAAIAACKEAIESLEPQARKRVACYVAARYL